jgi:Xaa-Pro dipeptidase
MHKPDRNEVELKLTRIRNYLERSGFTGLVLARKDNFSWLSCGGNNRVVVPSDEGVGAFVITKDKFFLVAQVMDGQRLLDEELTGLELEYVPLHWYEVTRVEKAIELAGSVPASDVPVKGAKIILSDIYALHYPLTENEIAKLRWLGKKVDEILALIASLISPGMIDYEVEALLLAQFASKNIQCDVLLVGTDERISKYRHPSPSGAKLGNYVLLHPVARFEGLHSNVTRSVYFGDRLPEGIKRPYRAVMDIEAACIASCVPGERWCDILDKQKYMLTQRGYPEEWRNHFPGGRTGYSVCEADFSLNSNKCIVENEAYDWFITVKGAKVEELSINTGGRREVLSAAGFWPVQRYAINNEVIELPDILLR